MLVVPRLHDEASSTSWLVEPALEPLVELASSCKPGIADTILSERVCEQWLCRTADKSKDWRRSPFQSLHRVHGTDFWQNLQ